MIHGVAFHYITTASTSETGSVMFYINKDRVGPGLTTSFSNFLPVVLSDHNTLIGPLWKNSTASFFPEPIWMPTDVGLGEDLRVQAAGELFVFTRTSVTDSPGYVLIDYDISFRNMQVNPRSLTLPLSRMKYTQVLATVPSAAYTAGNAGFFTFASGSLMDGVTASVPPTGATVGDVYKVVLNLTNATFTNCNASNLVVTSLIGGNSGGITLTDGFTLYCVYAATNKFYMTTNYNAAEADGATIGWGQSATFSATFPAYVSFVGSLSYQNNQANF